MFRIPLVRHLVIAGLAFVCAGLVFLAILDRVVMPIIVRQGSATATPTLIGKPIDVTRQEAQNMGFVVVVDSTEYNERMPENSISFQYPGPGTEIKPGRRIRVIVSLGARPVIMPDVVGKSQRDAELILKSEGLLILQQEWVHSGQYVRGIVARQDPPSGSEVPQTTGVVLSISDGQPVTDTVMPNVIELGLSAALDTLHVYGFADDRIMIQQERAPELLPETVIDQHPDPGTAVSTESTTVDLIVSTSE